MDRDTWDTLLGRLKEALVQRSRDPGVFLDADWDEQEIRIRTNGVHDGEWMSFELEPEDEEKAPRQLAVEMVEEALGSE